MHTEPVTTAQQSRCSSQNSGYKLFGTHRALKMRWGGGCSSLFSVISEIQSSLLFRLDAHLCPACRVKPLPGESAPTCHPQLTDCSWCHHSYFRSAFPWSMTPNTAVDTLVIHGLPREVRHGFLSQKKGKFFT